MWDLLANQAIALWKYNWTYSRIEKNSGNSRFTTDYGFKSAITGFLTEKKRFVTKLFLVAIPKKDLNIKYFGLSLGYRFL